MRNKSLPELVMSDLALVPSSSTLGDFILRTSEGDVLFTGDEYVLYNSLFKAMDYDDDGRIRYKDTVVFLQRPGVSQVSR